MLKQKLIYYRDIAQLSASVEKLSDDGWRVVPGTQIVVVSTDSYVGIVMEKGSIARVVEGEETSDNEIPVDDAEANRDAWMEIVGEDRR